MDELPKEIITKIIYELNVSDIFNIKSINKEFNNISIDYGDYIKSKLPEYKYNILKYEELKFIFNNWDIINYVDDSIFVYWMKSYLIISHLKLVKFDVITFEINYKNDEIKSVVIDLYPDTNECISCEHKYFTITLNIHNDLLTAIKKYLLGRNIESIGYYLNESEDYINISNNIDF